MANLTRIKNNQITDSTVNAAAKLQNYTVTSTKLANSLVYGSDLTVSGNLTVNGTTTTIDTVNTLVQDPLITLADGQTAGTPTLDIGTIGLRGSELSAVLAWKENQTEFVAALSNTTVSNTTFNLTQYANFHANTITAAGDLSVVGNITGTINFTGNVTAGNLLTTGIVSAAGNIRGANINTAGLITATGNISGGNVLTVGLISATGNAISGNLLTEGQVSATSNVTGGNLLTGGLISATSTIISAANITGGNLLTGGLISATGNATAGNILTGGLISATSTIISAANITGGNVLTGGLISATGTITSAANISGGNVLTGGLISATGNITGGNLSTSGSGGSISGSGNIIGGNILTTGVVSATGNITAQAGSFFIGNGSQLTGVAATTATSLTNGTTNVTTALNGNANITIAGTSNVAVFATTGEYVTGVISATGNITGGNIISDGQISASGDIAGNNIYGQGVVSTVGNVTGGNITTVGLVSASGTITSASNIIGGNVLTGGIVSSSGNVIGGNLVTNGILSVTGNATAGNILTSGLISATGSGTFGGNVSGGNLVTTGIISTSGNIYGGNLIVASIESVTGNISGGNIFTAGQVSATGNATAGNILTGGLISATGDITTAGNVNTNNIIGTGITITSTGTLNLAPTGNITANSKNITGLADPVNDQDAATKYYVDSVAQGLDIKASVTLTSVANLAPYTYNNGTSGVGATLTASANGALSLDSTTVTANARVLIKNEVGAFVNNTTQSAAFNGIYLVTQTGNATAPYILTRTTDFDAPTEIPGAFTFVEYGTTAADTGWVCTTNSPITVGTTEILFTQFSGAGSYTANTQAGLTLVGSQFNAKVDNDTTAFDGGGNISVKPGANLVTPNIGAATGTSLSLTGAVNAGTTISAPGNVTGGNILTTGYVSATGTGTFGGNVTGGNILTGGLLSVTGNINSAGNINQTGTGNINGYNGYFSNSVTVIANLYTTANLVTTNAGIFYGNTITGNGAIYAGVPGYTILGSNVVAQFAGNVNAYSQLNFQNINGGTQASTDFILTNDTGNDTVGFMDMGIASSTWDGSQNNSLGTAVKANDGYLYVDAGNLVLGTSDPTTSLKIVAGGTGSSAIVANISNIGAQITGIVSATGNVTGGNVLTSGLVSATGSGTFGGNVTGGNVLTGGLISATGNATVGNISTAGIISAAGNIIANPSSFFIGNGSQLTGVTATSAGFPITSGTTNISAISSGNIYVTVAGTPNVVVWATTGEYVTGVVSATGNVTGGNIISNGGNVDVLSGFVNAAAVITSGRIEAGTSISANGNVTGGNILTSGLVSATGNVTGGNLLYGAGIVSGTGNIYGANLIVSNIESVTGNITGGNLLTGGQVSATANITGGNVLTGGLISATGNATAGNVLTSGIVSATANVTGGNLLTGGLVSATGTGTFGNIVLSGDNINQLQTDRSIIVNGASANTNFAVNGLSANVFFVNATTNTASFGSNVQTTNALVAFNTTTSILTPVGNTSQRPGTGVTGMLRFNTTNNALEIFDNSAWTSVGTPTFTVIADEQFSGDGSTVAFTLGSTQTTNSCIVSINGVIQVPGSAYSVSGTDPTCVLTFTEAPASGDLIDVREITTTTTITSISNSPGNAVVSTTATSNIVLITGQLSVTGGILGLNSASISNGTSNVNVVSSGGNVTVGVGGTSNVAVFSTGGLTLAGGLFMSNTLPNGFTAVVGQNGLFIGPMTVNDGDVATVPTGASMTIL